MAEYDPAVLQKFADKLYMNAIAVIIGCTILGSIVGAVCGKLVVAFAPKTLSVDSSALLWGATLLCLGVGFLIGQERAFRYKLEAQRTLCQMQIERNTRLGAGAPAL